jgi:hypothetical protein
MTTRFRTRFKMGTMLVGNQERGTCKYLFVCVFISLNMFKDFSCRSSATPRLLFGGKKLTYEKNPSWWRIHIIRIRQFGRKLVQLVLDSENLSNQSNIEIVSSDFFLMTGDYLLLECKNISQSNCYFLIYYFYKSKSIEKENFCQNNEFPNLFKFVIS